MIATSVGYPSNLWNISNLNDPPPSPVDPAALSVRFCVDDEHRLWANHLRCFLNRAHSSVSLPSLGPCLTDGMDSLSLPSHVPDIGSIKPPPTAKAGITARGGY
jgi:hypothetical protein